MKQRFSFPLAVALVLAGLAFCCVALPATYAQQDPRSVFDFLLGTPDQAFNAPVSTEGAQGLRDILIYYAGVVKSFIAVIAVLLIIISGLRMVTAGGNADANKKSLTGIFILLFGLILMQVAEVIVSIFFTPSGRSVNDIRDFPDDIRERIVNPLLSFFLSFLAITAVFVIIISGVRMITALGDEARIKKLQRVFIPTTFGLIVILIARPLIQNFYGETSVNPNPSGAISLVLQVVNYILGFSAISGILMLLYAAINMIVNFGNDQKVQKARKTILWVVLGLALLVSAYTIVTFFAAPLLNSG